MMDAARILALFGTAALVFPGAELARARLLPVGSKADAPPWIRWCGLGGALGVLVIAVLFGGAMVLGALLVGAALLWWRRRRAVARTSDPLALAAAWDLLAVTLRAGVPVVVALRAAADELLPVTARPLREVAALLEWGADGEAAWGPALAVAETGELARAARRTARTGCALADAAAALARDERAAAAQRARARAHRAAVWVTVPLGLCFLPAFLCLGVGPLVLGMFNDVRSSW